MGDSEPTVEWGGSLRSLSQSAVGKSWDWTEGSRTHTSHAATMTGLTPGETYFYRVGSPVDGWSSVRPFVATRTGAELTEELPLRVLVLGDLGYDYAQSLTSVQTEAAKGVYDHLIHLGDFAYDFNEQGGVQGDNFQAMIEPITATLAYTGCVGNHEGASSFLAYTHRMQVFAMDGSSGLTPSVPGITGGVPNNHWFSYTAGQVFFISMSTEAYFSYTGALQAQYDWMEAQLASVDRARTPWVIVYGHRSVYCSCDGDCDGAATTVREGAHGLEELFRKHRVDLFLNGHEHNYERLYPTYKSAPGSFGRAGAAGGNAANPEVITNADSPVYIIDGAAGNREKHEPFTRAQPAWSAFRSNSYGYGRLTVFNATHLQYEHVQTDDEPEYAATTGTVIDAMLLVKTAPVQGTGPRRSAQ
jgi:predicted phosphodiesterase